MKPSKPKKKKSAKQPGPKPERLKLEGPWQDRIRESFKAKPVREAKKHGRKG